MAGLRARFGLSSQKTAGLAAIVIWAAGLAACLCFWPGIMIWDSGRQYGQALSGAFDDWHPPLMEGVWRLLIALWPGPGPMLILQLGIYGTALGSLAYGAWRRGEAHLAAWLGATGLFPPTLLLMATVIKDSLMAAVLLAAFALLAQSRDSGGRLPRLGGVALIVVASCLRFNAFLAALPLLLMALPPRWIAHRGKLALMMAVATVLLLLAMPVANRLLHAERSGVELSLVMFDLGGITAHGGGDAFPPVAVDNPVAANQGCYLAEKWDPYSWWVAHPCPIQFADVRAAFAARGINPEIFWARAIAAHPLAYAAHRFEHGNIAGAFLVRHVPERWIVSASDPNDWGFRVEPNFINRTVVGATWALNATPLGWPCWWLAFSFAPMVLGRREPQILALAGSAFLYSLGYGVFSVASELRYYCWPMMATLIAAVMLTARWREVKPLRTQQIIAATPLLLVALFGLGWRWL